ncbi:hypothetical protein C7S16_5286 [Burkholderia thailandensis]|uniref:Uncharacterized protein n=1 Tax=Burkholderia thailandensis TaxID=57975 RepID=A0AAW9CR85_BURTH|nr:hypothetical protein [Burkholderia thailandensis]MDW9253448.1 hypothetical protein [Burkholderia thailandensis]
MREEVTDSGGPASARLSPRSGFRAGSRRLAHAVRAPF